MEFVVAVDDDDDDDVYRRRGTEAHQGADSPDALM